MAVYGRARLHDLRGTVNRLPSLRPTELDKDSKEIPLAATGADGGGKSLTPALTPESDFRRLVSKSFDDAEVNSLLTSGERKLLQVMAFDEARGREIAEEKNAPSRARSVDPLIKSQDWQIVNVDLSKLYDINNSNSSYSGSNDQAKACGTVRKDLIVLSPELRRVIEAWPKLTEEFRNAILLIVKANLPAS
ncbi:hypothetical protein KIH39_22625 [Telmatocola sphagniphila]|uniref:Uncharacterized protein n=1 Tax=Telmatocola sphagniphila TaxID=1123043 RepID=A0A8E6ESY4_9BACT|nr:hypothetical protein [Telmatocola sphagniphila]QVL31609.1 hypothetical protein KIH39_22625 [Telmatocola sphagniphila]